MRLFMITFISLLTMNTTTAQFAPAIGSQDDPRTTAEESWQKATDEARQIAAAYREASAAEQPDEQFIQRLKSELKAAVTKAFESQTQLQTIRLQLAEENLQRVRAKLQRREKLSASIIARRVARLRTVEGSSSTPPAVADRMTDPLADKRTMQIRIVVPPGWSDLFPESLVPGTLITLTVHLHAPHMGTTAHGIATPVKLESVSLHADRMELTLLVTSAQAKAIRGAHEISPYWFRPFPFSAKHLETFASAESLSVFMKDHPELEPDGPAEWLYEGNRTDVSAPSPEYLQQFGMAFRVATSTDLKTDLSGHRHRNPEALFSTWNRYYQSHDARRLVSLMDDAAVSELAGLLLVNATFYANADSDVIYVQIAEALKTLLRKYRHDNPPLEARIAEAVIYKKKVTTDPRGPVTDELRKYMVAAVESLKQPRQFCVDALSAFMPLTNDPTIELPVWQVTAVNKESTRVIATTTYLFPMMSETFEAERSDSGWLIHSVFSPTLPKDSTRAESPSLRYSETPEALMAEWVRCSDGNNVADLVPLMDDNAASEFAAVMLFATTSISTVAQLAQTIEAAEFDGDMAQMLLIPAILERHKHDDPPPEAQLAYSQLSAVAVQVMFQGQLTDAKAPLPPKLLQQQLKTAVGILKDPRAFVVELGPVFSAMSDADQKAKSDLHWRIVARSEDSVTVLVGSKDQPQKDAEMVLKKQNAGWLLHAYLSERTVSQLIPSFSPSIPPQAETTGVISDEPAPVAPPDSFVAIRPIASGDRITWDNVAPVGSPAATPELVGALPKGHPYRDTRLRPYVGRYSAVSLAAGDSITPEQMISPTPTKLVELKMASGSSESLVSTWHESTSLMFSEQTTEAIRSELPNWTGDYIEAVNAALSEAKGKWTPQMVSMLASLDCMIHVSQEDDDWDLHTTGQLLREWLQHNGQNDDVEINRSIHSAPFLSRLARTTDGIPAELFDSEPLAQETHEKLTLFRTLVANNANQKWIEQEAQRLPGLLHEAPVAVVMAILQSGDPSKLASKSHLLEAIGPDNSESNEPYVTIDSTVTAASRGTSPLDPVLLLSILATKAGENDAVDQRMASLLRGDMAKPDSDPSTRHSSTLAGMLDNSVDEILKGKLTNRTTVLRSLTTIYRKSSSDELKKLISQMAPGVPVRAKAMDDDTLHLRDNHGNAIGGNMKSIPRDRETIARHLQRSKRITVSSGGRNDSLEIEHRDNLRELAEKIYRIVHAEQIPVLVLSDEMSALDGQLIIWPGSREGRAKVTLQLLDVLKQATAPATNATDFSFDDDALYADDYTQITKDPAAIVAALETADAILLGEEYSAETYPFHGLSLESDLDRQTMVAAILPTVQAANNITLFAGKDRLFIAAPQYTADLIAKSILQTIQENLPAKAAEPVSERETEADTPGSGEQPEN